MDIETNQLTDETKKKRKRRLCIAVISLVLIPILIGFTVFGAYHVLRVSGKKDLGKNVDHIAPVINRNDDAEEKKGESYDSTLCYYQGKTYRYNVNTINILCIGIDKFTEEIEEVEEKSGEGGQADAIFLVSFDPDRNKTDIYAISRDTMVPIKSFDVSGNYVGEDLNHLALAYSYGDGAHTSCEMTKEAVSSLFYQLPIHGYCALNLQAIAKLNDMVGGVTVTVSEDLEKMESSFIAGERLTLTGEQAMLYMQKRNMETVDGNDLRMERQKQYINGFIDSVKKALKQDIGLSYQLYKEVTGQMVTNLKLNNAVYLTDVSLNSEFKMENIQRLPGTTKEGIFYSEFHLDEDAMYELILKNFYTEVQE